MTLVAQKHTIVILEYMLTKIAPKISNKVYLPYSINKDIINI